MHIRLTEKVHGQTNKLTEANNKKNGKQLWLKRKQYKLNNIL